MNPRTARTHLRPCAVCVLALAVLLLGGCSLTLDIGSSLLAIPGTFLSNLGGWNLSACGGGGFQTCTGLLVDNQQQIFGGQTVEEVVYGAVTGFFGAGN